MQFPGHNAVKWGEMPLLGTEGLNKLKTQTFKTGMFYIRNETGTSN